MFKVARRIKYLSNCETAFCHCNDCTSEGEKLASASFPVLKTLRKFTCCEHGVHPRQCTECQTVAFEKVSVSTLTKDVRGLICGIITAAPLKRLHCCRCESGFTIMTARQLNDNGYGSEMTFAEGCDSRVFFVGASVLIIAHEFSKYGDDGFSITAGILTDAASGVSLSAKQATKTYGLQPDVLVCDHCIDFMLTNGELKAGGGVNEDD